MRRIGLLIAVFAALAALTGPASGRITKPTLRIADRSPLAVQGLRFRAAERVTVVAWSEGRHVRIVRASQLGRFLARFPKVNPDSCAALAITATGKRGSRAVLKVMPKTECPPPGPVG